MTPFTTLTGPAAPLPRPNLDTDVIIRIEHLTAATRDDLGRHAFAPLRYRPDGSENPDFILNQPAFRGAPILLAGPNFGCGSSREGAVWALLGLGLRCIIAEGFGDIFVGNCFQNGLLPVVLPRAAVETLAQQATAPGAQVTVDLLAQRVTAPGGETFPFTISPLRRTALLEGLDELDGTRRLEPEITAWQARDRVARPWIWRDPPPAPGAGQPSDAA